MPGNNRTHKEKAVSKPKHNIKPQENPFNIRLQAIIKLFEELKTARDNETTTTGDFNQAVYTYNSVYQRTAKEFNLPDQKKQLEPYQIED